jgi:hypothetical protein
MTAFISILNTTYNPLLANMSWNGYVETSQTYLTIFCTIATDTIGVLNVYQSTDGIVDDYVDTFNILANVSTNVFETQIKSKFYHMEFTNTSVDDQTYLKLITKLIDIKVAEDITEINSSNINTGISTLHTDLTSTGIKILTMPNVTTTEANSLGYSNISVTNTGVVIKNSPGIVKSVMVCVTGGNKFCYLKIYNKSTVPTTSDTPVVVIPVQDTTHSSIVPLYNLEFSNGISIRGTDNVAVNDNTTPAGPMICFVSYI